MQDLPKRNQLNAQAFFVYFLLLQIFSIVNDSVPYRQSHGNVIFVSAEYESSHGLRGFLENWI